MYVFNATMHAYTYSCVNIYYIIHIPYAHTHTYTCITALFPQGQVFSCASLQCASVYASNTYPVRFTHSDNSLIRKHILIRIRNHQHILAGSLFAGCQSAGAAAA